MNGIELHDVLAVCQCDYVHLRAVKDLQRPFFPQKLTKNEENL